MGMAFLSSRKFSSMKNKIGTRKFPHFYFFGVKNNPIFIKNM